MKSKGFTLIELLIVIALLGALAVGLLATIDPFEQLKKGNDTSTRNTVSEFYNAAIRYYAINHQFPWGTEAMGPSSLYDISVHLDALASAGELKAKFIDLATTSQLARISVYSPTSDQLAVCFRPESKSMRRDPAVLYDGKGSALSGCPTSASVECYWCVQ